jgi:hypothetical protein
MMNSTRDEHFRYLRTKRRFKSCTTILEKRGFRAWKDSPGGAREPTIEDARSMLFMFVNESNHKRVSKKSKSDIGFSEDFTRRYQNFSK